MRVLITPSPRMFRVALDVYIHKHRPLADVRIGPPEAAEEQIERFRPRLLVKTDTDELDPETLARVPLGWRYSTPAAWPRGSS